MASTRRTISKFISEPVTVYFSSPPAFTKKPPSPNQFTWRGDEFIITECLSEWSDFSRRGRMAKNMQPQHARVAANRGSWGVGRFFFEVRTQCGRFFRLYYDRAPADAVDRAGQWVLMAELANIEE